MTNEIIELLSVPLENIWVTTLGKKINNEIILPLIKSFPKTNLANLLLLPKERLFKHNFNIKSNIPIKKYCDLCCSVVQINTTISGVSVDDNCYNKFMKIHNFLQKIIEEHELFNEDEYEYDENNFQTMIEDMKKYSKSVIFKDEYIGDSQCYILKSLLKIDDNIETKEYEYIKIKQHKGDKILVEWKPTITDKSDLIKYVNLYGECVKDLLFDKDQITIHWHDSWIKK